MRWSWMGLLFGLIVSFGCMHTPILVEKPLQIKWIAQDSLPSRLNECSGLTFDGTSVFALNDGGDQAVIYRLDPVNFDIQQTIIVKDQTNTDWEALTYADGFLSIGDFGNNFKNRPSLWIHDGPSSFANDTMLVTNSVLFRYAEQTDFTTALIHNFDAEAMVKINGKFHIFSKNRADGNSYHYELENRVGEQVVSPKDTLAVGGLVTDACLVPNSGAILLLLYTINGNTFTNKLAMVTTINGHMVLRQIIDLPMTTQCEGITFLDEHTLIIASEAEIGGQNFVYRFEVY